MGMSNLFPYTAYSSYDFIILSGEKCVVISNKNQCKQGGEIESQEM